MLKSKNDDMAYSFVMGVDNTIEGKLSDLNCNYIIQNNKYYLTSIPKNKLGDYENMIIEYLKPGFWNEYLSDKVVFIFKNKDNNILRYEWNIVNEKEILKLCNEYANLNENSIEEMLLAETFYNENSIEI